MLNETKLTVCMLSCQHSLQDDRIYWKEAVSLQQSGYQVIHIGVGDSTADYFTPEGIRLVQLVRRKYFSHPIIDKLFRILTFKKDITADILKAASGTTAAIYHFHDLQINKIGPSLKKLPWQPKLVYDVHESYPDLIRDHSSRWLTPFNYVYAFYIEKWELACAAQYDAVITTEEYVLNRFRKVMQGRPCLLIYNYSYFLPGTGPVQQIPKIYDAIYSGTISAARGVYEIAHAVLFLKKIRPSVTVILIGNFTSKKTKQGIQSFIVKNNLAENLILHDPVPFEQMDFFYSSSKTGLCVLHPLKLFKNAVFIKVFEYMAFGLPVVGSNFGTLADYIKSNDAGITIDPLQPEAIGNAILQLLTDSELYKNCSENGMNAVSEKYNWQSEAIKLLPLYQEILVTA